jgi:type II secretory ATPase GspE/PulE/Tfp pilus assembly ATPase PilB-like protein
LVAYAVAVSRDDRVPEQFKIRVDVLQKMAASRAEKRKTKSAGAAKLVVRFPDKSTMPVPEAESPEMAVRSAAEMVYLSALAQRASQIEIVPSGKDQTYAVRMLVDGVGIAGDTMPAQNAIRVMDWWKSTAKLDVADRRKKLQGLATIEHAGGKRTIRVTSIGVQGGMRVEILFDPDTAVRRPAKDLGLLDNQMEELKALIADEKRGVVVLAGPPDGGRTTAFYSIVGMHDAYTQSVGTHEMDQQLILEGVRHQQFDAQTDGPDFATSTRSLLRRDPDVLGVAEMPDANTAKEIAKADGERTRTYVGVRATSATEGIEKYVQAVGDNALAAKHFRGVVAGRLLR